MYLPVPLPQASVLQREVTYVDASKGGDDGQQQQRHPATTYLMHMTQVRESTIRRLGVTAS